VLISSHRAQLKVAQDSLKNVDRSLMETNKRLGMAKTEIESIEEKIKRVESTEKSQEAFQYYVKCVCRDGIPYELICGAVPEIDREVNIILNQITDFHAKFETDGKNIIPYISSGDGTSKWTMRLSSGFEKFVLGLAIRVALINLSNLPRPNFIMIDEGWGTADAENLANVPPLLSFLRTSFDFLLIISHLDTMKDMVDGTIDIVKEGEFSKVRFE
jgi:DNA repair exonuclease SbcCD ATPase subunit